jgi:hypothetical protein
MVWLRVHAGLEPTDKDDLVPGPDSDGEEAVTMAQDGIGAVVRPLQDGMMLLRCTQTRGGQRRPPRISSGSWQPELCLQGREKTGACSNN